MSILFFSQIVSAFNLTEHGFVLGSLIETVHDIINDSFVNTNQPQLSNYNLEIDYQNPYGKIIPRVYGKANIVGSIIWISKVKTNSYNGNLQLSRPKDHIYYTVSFAIAICHGEIISVDDIIINGKSYNRNYNILKNIRVYLGDEFQEPDHLIIEHEGVENTSAYRGIAYVVFEDFNISEYYEKIPSISFVVTRNTYNIKSVEKMINSINIIPGSGEFVYDTDIQKKEIYEYGSYRKKCINQNAQIGKSDAVVAMENMKKTLPNIKWVSIVINWFCNSLDASKIKIFPCIEDDNLESESYPDIWRVEMYIRDNAYIIGKEKSDGCPRYGGTISDNSLTRFCRFLKESGYKIMIYPMLLVDLDGKPWRGEITGNSNDSYNFFNSNEGYNRFILHYADLTKDFADCFIIGSEFKGLTKIKDKGENFPFVDGFISLSKKVRNIVGKKIKITYCADWSEYHNTKNGWYNLDELWADNDIDFIGIDAYFPLTDSKDSVYSIEELMNAWESGPEYDYFYDENQMRQNLSEKYACKNLKWWWENEHINPNGKKTKWIPRSKKIWFTEYGFPSVNLSTNEPNVFFDPKTYNSRYPKYSDGLFDRKIQRKAIEATERKWKNSDMVERIFLWCWDARPYPVWPFRSDIWKDSECWKLGHWVQGKLGTISIGDIIKEISILCGLEEDEIYVEDIYENIHGFVLNGQNNIKKIIDMIRLIYNINVYEKDYKLYFTKEKKDIHKISTESMVSLPSNINNFDKPFSIVIESDKKHFQNINLDFLDVHNSCLLTNISYITCVNRKTLNISLPIILDKQEAYSIAKHILRKQNESSVRYIFSLPMHFNYIKVNDILELTINNQLYFVKVDKIIIGQNYIICIHAVSYIPFIKDTINKDQLNIKNDNKIEKLTNDIDLIILEFDIVPHFINKFDYDGQNVLNLMFLYYGESSYINEVNIYYKKVDNLDYQEEFNEISLVGECICGDVIDEELNEDCVSFIDFSNVIFIKLNSGCLNSLSGLLDLFNNNMENYAYFNGEIIKFQNVELISRNTYRIKNIIRGLYNSQQFFVNINEYGLYKKRFIILNPKMTLTQIFIDNKQLNETNLKLNIKNSLNEKKIDYNCKICGKNPLGLYSIQIEVNEQHLKLFIFPKFKINKIFPSEYEINEYINKKNVIFNITIKADDKNIYYSERKIYYPFIDLIDKDIIKNSAEEIVFTVVVSYTENGVCSNSFNKIVMY